MYFASRVVGDVDAEARVLSFLIFLRGFIPDSARRYARFGPERRHGKEDRNRPRFALLFILQAELV